MHGVVPLISLDPHPPSLAGRFGDHTDHRLPTRMDVNVFDKVCSPIIGASVAFHRGVVGCDQLSRHHGFEFVLRPNTDQRRNGGLIFEVIVSFAKAIFRNEGRRAT